MSQPTITLGAVGPAVHTLQQDLLERGFVFFSEEMDEDFFGETTARAVETYQASHGLVVDRIVGPRTWAMLARTERPVETETPLVLPTLPAGFTQASAALDRASADLRAGVRETPPHSNRGKRIDEMTRFRGASSLPGPRWCCYAVSDWWNNAFRFGGVSNLIRWARHRNLVSDAQAGATAQSGDLFFTVVRDRAGVPKIDGGRHVGLVVAGEDRKIVTIEGNSGDRVRSLVRSEAGLLFARVPDAAFR